MTIHQRKLHVCIKIKIYTYTGLNKIRHHMFLFLICTHLIKSLLGQFLIHVLKANCTSAVTCECKHLTLIKR